MSERVYWLHALTPLHVGAGRGEGYIDLPIVREKVTNFPYVPGASTKGVYAAACGATDDARDQKHQNYNKNLHAAFGVGGSDDANAGALVFTDARLLCLPLRSLYGTFCWATSTTILQRITRDIAGSGLVPPAVPNDSDDALVVPGNKLRQKNSKKIFLEDLDLDEDDSADATQWANFISGCLFDANSSWHDLFKQRFAILPSDIFDFLNETGTEVQAHIRIDNDFKRVVDGALWYEESLPAESILYGSVWCEEPRGVNVSVNQVEQLLQNQTLQMGGKETTGKGRVAFRISDAIASGGTNDSDA